MSATDGADHRRVLLRRLVLPWRTVPAVVYDRHLTVRIANDLARAVHPTFRPGTNLARAAFLRAGDGPTSDSADDRTPPPWPSATEPTRAEPTAAGPTRADPTAVGPTRAEPTPAPPGTAELGARLAAELRRSLDEHHEDRGYVELVGELAARSDAFARLWAGPGDAEPNGSVGFAHPAVGHLVLSYHRFGVPGPDGDTLLLWHGADRVSSERLAALADSLPH
ncbi:hypothetical protein SAMN02800687_1346 [Curtobacterium sp. UNCCL20]|uniref:MmyB family transcriptional regulator n=1 Tax=Curtobacterium sp. UNCCL20 TaxID=1502773 RepID=UPI00088B59D7|nr:hypothetical protein [Curtobacterium sp. UNCCL20]SDQ31120.1 hypothetical protein SAMN02800687_1346 [Curtobacterium sp. UNCCL20]